MSVVSRILLTGLAIASLACAPAALAAAPDNQSGDTRAEFGHAAKCIASLGFGGGCDQKEPLTKEQIEAKKAEHDAKVTKVSDNTGTRAQFGHAFKCIGSLGFGGGCEKKDPYGTASNPKTLPGPADTSTRGQFVHATKCLGTLGFGSGCDPK